MPNAAARDSKRVPFPPCPLITMCLKAERHTLPRPRQCSPGWILQRFPIAQTHAHTPMGWVDGWMDGWMAASPPSSSSFSWLHRHAQLILLTPS